MKRIVLAFAFIVLASLVAIVPASAQERTVTANVPFDFAVGDRVLPTGTYRIEPVNNTFQVFIDSEGRQSAAFAMGFPNDRKANQQSKLVFDKVGNKYFLKEIVTKSAGTSLAFPESKLEKKAQEQGGSGEIRQTAISAD